MAQDTSRVNYADANNWLYRPDAIDKPVDVFYLYPTAWMRRPGEGTICPIDHAGMRKGAQTVFFVQASALFPVGNVFAPYYRQMDGGAILASTPEEINALVHSAPARDLADAFAHYMRHANGGRPFILLSHSQGSLTMKQLLFDFMPVHPDIYARMIAAYVIGYGVTRGELAAHPHLRFAECAEDTGVIVSYNTEAPGETRSNPTAPDGTLVINPLNWRRDETPAPAEMNLGSLITGRGRLVTKRQFADATIDLARGTLICATADPADYGGDPALGAFHSSDIAFYYVNLRENAKARVAAYFAERGLPAAQG